MKKINHLISALIMAAMTAGFASCSSSDEPSSVSDNTPKELTITIKTQGVTTKAAASDNDPGASAENTMNRITIGIFDQSGTTVRAIQEFTASSGDSEPVQPGNYYFNQSNNSATFTVVTTKMESSDKILVAVNAPAKYFAGVSTETEFRDKQLTADEALYRDKADQQLTSGIAVNDNIPMFGESKTITKGTGTTYSATISVKHLTAKVTLDELKVDFAADGRYSEATFTPTEIFMYNVPDGVKFNTNDQCSSTTFLTGESTSSTNKKDYLSSGAFSGSALSGDNTAVGTNTFGTDYFFYVTPNSTTSGNITKLVIKGNFDPDGASGPTSSTTVYYPVKLNYNVKADGSTGVPSGGSTSAFIVSPNKNYKCSVTIKTIGSDGPGTDIDPTTAEITITVIGFEAVDQTTVFQ